jgi:hypothetical protein
VGAGAARMEAGGSGGRAKILGGAIEASCWRRSVFLPAGPTYGTVHYAFAGGDLLETVLQDMCQQSLLFSSKLG